MLILGPKCHTFVPTWPQNDSKSDSQNGCFSNKKTSILAAIYYTLATLAPPRPLPKSMRKLDPTKIDPKRFNLCKLVPKWVSKWTPLFPGFGQKWVSILVLIPKGPQEKPRNLKMHPNDPRWCLNCSNIAPKWFKILPKHGPNITPKRPQFPFPFLNQDAARWRKLASATGY